MTAWTVQDLKQWRSNQLHSNRRAKTSQNLPCDYETFANQLLRRTKLISQLIASSWLEGEKATKIREIFTQFSTGHDDSDLRELLTGQKADLWAQRIFDDDEIELYRFEISWNTFEGTLNENQQAIQAQKPPYFTMVLPYPPRPVLGGFTVTLDQIQNWVNSPLQEDNKGLIQNPFPSSPYIPLTTC
jgi:hypothetical protein